MLIKPQCHIKNSSEDYNKIMLIIFKQQLFTYMYSIFGLNGNWYVVVLSSRFFFFTLWHSLLHYTYHWDSHRGRCVACLGNRECTTYTLFDSISSFSLPNYQEVLVKSLNTYLLIDTLLSSYFLPWLNLSDEYRIPFYLDL